MSSISIPEGQRGPPLDEYERRGPLGSGGFGHVSLYKLKEHASQRTGPGEMAVKATLISGQGNARELGVIFKLKHDNIVSLLGAEVGTDCLYIKMEVAKADLSKLKNELSWEAYSVFDVSLFAHQIVCGLCYLHRNSIVHRDLKPQNILAFWECHRSSVPSATSILLKLTDFNLSRFVPENPITTTAVGTGQYMAPEVALSFHKLERFRGDYRKADVFSVGVVIYELLYGQRPFPQNVLYREALPEERAGTSNDNDNDINSTIGEMLRWNPLERSDSEKAKLQFSSHVTVDSSHFACPVCLDVPRENIFTCTETHNICSDCHEGLPAPKICPTCRQPFDDPVRRNREMEKIIASLADIELKCKFSKRGCSHAAKRSLIIDHEESCNFQLFPCPLKECKESISANTIGDHFKKDDHKANYFDNYIYVSNWLLASYPAIGTEEAYRPGVFKWKGMHFVFFWEFVIEQKMSFIWVAVAGSESVANKYVCEITIDNDRIEPVYRYKGPVLSVDKKIDYVARLTLGMPLTRCVLRRYRKGGPTDPWNDHFKYPRLYFKITINEK